MLTTTTISRSRLVRLGLGGAAGFVGLATAESALAAEPTEGDLATVRLLASGELLAQAFYTRAIASKKLSKAEVGDLESARRHERDHYVALANLLGTARPLAGDFEFAFPEDTFTWRGRMLRVGEVIETALAGSYASAAATASTPELRAVLAQAAVSEGQHLSVLNRMRGGAPAPSFPELFDVEQASAALGPFFGD